MSQNDTSMTESWFSYIFGRYRLHVGESNQLTLFSDEREVKIRTVEAVILCLLLQEPGKVRTTIWLLDAVNRSSNATENLVHGAIKGLRKALNDEEIIKNEWGVGYYLTYKVEIRPDENIGPPINPPPISPVGPPSSAAVTSPQTLVVHRESAATFHGDPAQITLTDIPSKLTSTVEPQQSLATEVAAEAAVAEIEALGVVEVPLPPVNGERRQTPVAEKFLKIAEVAPEVPVSAKQPDPFVFLATISSLAVLAFPFLFATAGWDKVPQLIGYTQALLIAVGIFFSPYPAKNAEAVSKREPALIAVGQLQRSWRWLLISWCALYLTLAISKTIGGPPDNPISFIWVALQVVNTFLNNCSALIFVLCYLVLNRRTVIPVNGEYVDDLPWKGWLVIVGAVSCLEFSVIVLFALVKGADGIRGVIFGADLLSGFLTGIAMALFISRLDSRILAGNQLLPIVPILLYFYVVIQPFYPLLNWPFARPDKPLLFSSSLILMEMAFLLKSVMYIYVVRLFRSERFPRYMKHARRFYEEIEKELSGAMPNHDPKFPS
ncbi:MAG TPA: winged helix-turn-helix domain-containing protein [Pyrinomonadaceae bacterium]|nr:winged helix-turn-helix domain-containing protein [Pyrinomonadaceae bacterium]